MGGAQSGVTWIPPAKKLSALTPQLRTSQDPEQGGDTGQHQEVETEKQGHVTHLFQDYIIPE